MNNKSINLETLKKAMWDEVHFITIVNECGIEEAKLGLTFDEIEDIINNFLTNK
jgi:cystathionine beta-lyase family protein involved in aluminum resistance